ncbi:hypothetical protein ACGFJC_03500 [Nonomuraea fuscirosea]|uniref:hypothetical protein n=1 Tax=Nonomuraea fuscirosea TaxID=1291556 RepID=UPI00348069B2
MNKAVYDEVCVLWAEHMGLPFPDDLRGVDIYDLPVVYLDSCIAGPITSYVGSQRGVLNDRQLRIVKECARDLRALLPRLRRREGRTYVARLVRIGELIIRDAPAWQQSPQGFSATSVEGL